MQTLLNELLYKARPLIGKSKGEAIWERLGHEPSGQPFNSLVQLEFERGARVTSTQWRW